MNSSQISLVCLPVCVGWASICFPRDTPGLTVGRLQDDSLTVGPDARGVESLDPGIVGTVEVKAVDGAQGLLADVHLLEETQTARQAPPLCGKFLLAAR